MTGGEYRHFRRGRPRRVLRSRAVAAKIGLDDIMIAVTGLGLAAALLFALSAVLQQRAAREAVGDVAELRDSSGVKRLFGNLIRSRAWLGGWLTNLCGVGTQAAALKVGSVATVQPLMAAQLMFVLAMASGEQRRWPSVRDWLSALAVCAGLVLVLTAYGAAPLTGAPHRHRVLLAMACVVSLIVVLRQVSRHSTPRFASLLVGVAAGLCHALNAVYLKLTVEDVYHGGMPAALVDWPVYALAATALTGMVLGQIAFASGPLPPAIAAMSVTNPVAGFILGIVAFDTPAPRDPGVLAAIAVSGVLIAIGVVGLANASTTRRLYRAERHPQTTFPLRERACLHVISRRVGCRRARSRSGGDAAEADVRGRAVLRLR